MATRTMNMCSVETHIDLLEKVGKIFKRLNQSIEIGYEALWSAKIAGKKCVAYISNDDDLEELWEEYGGHHEGAGEEEEEREGNTSGNSPFGKRSIAPID